MSWSGLPTRIEAKITPEPNSGCWIWLGAANDSKNPYGAAGWKNQKWKVHRLSYTLLRGEIPPGLSLDHLCRNTWCCNPAHLEPVSWKTNIRRGVGEAAKNFSKTHCPQEHEYTVENTYFWKEQRFCRACHKVYSNVYSHKKRAAK